MSDSRTAIDIKMSAYVDVDVGAPEVACRWRLVYPFSDEQEARIRSLAGEIAATMIAQAHGTGNGTIVRLPVDHIDDVAPRGERHHG